MKKTLSILILAIIIPGSAFAVTNRIVAIADTRGNNANFYVNTNVLRRVVNGIIALNPQPDAVIVSGDLINTPDNIDNSYQQFTNTMGPLAASGIPYYCVIGNHELGTDWYAKWRTAFSLPTNGPVVGSTNWLELTYYQDVGNVRLIGMDCISGGTNGAGAPADIYKIDARQRAWLASVGGTNSPAEFDIVFAHAPAYPATVVHASDCLNKFPPDRDAFVELLSDMKSSVYCSGHEHLYFRREVDTDYNTNCTYGVPHLVNSSGAPLYTALNGNLPQPDATNTTDFTFILMDLNSDTGWGTATARSMDGLRVLDSTLIKGKNAGVLLTFTNSVFPEGAGTLTNWGRVVLPQSISSNVTVTLESSDTTEVSVVSSVMIPSNSLSAVFDINVLNDAERDGLQSVLITAKDDSGTYRTGTGLVEVADIGAQPPYPLASFPMPTMADRFSFEAGFGLTGGPETNDFSACCIMPSSGELMVILRVADPGTGYAIQVYDRDGTYKRYIDLDDFSDTEGICSVRPADDTFAILEEDYNEFTVVTITTNTTNIKKGDGVTYDMGLAFGNGYNKGIEGIAFDPLNDCFYSVKEYDDRAVYRTTTNGPTPRTVELFDAERILDGICDDLSDVAYDPFSGHLFILSDQSQNVVECDLTGRIISTKSLVGPQLEGIALWTVTNTTHMYLTSEPNIYVRYGLAGQSGEGDEGEDLELTVGLSSAQTNTVDVNFVVSSTNAIPGIDCSPATGLVAFAAGSVSETLSLSIVREGMNEGDETISIILTNGSGTTVSYDSLYSYVIRANTTNDTPEWWLEQQYPGTNDYTNAALSDTDGDTLAAWAEYRAGTGATNALSVLGIVGFAPTGGNFELSWASVTNREYSVQASTNLLSTWSAPLLTNDMPGDASGTNTIVIPPTYDRAFYRILVE